MPKRKIIKPVLLLLFLVIIFSGCKGRNGSNTEEKPLSKNAFKLNTIVTITLYDSDDESIIDGAMAICDKYEQIYSRTLESSELYRLNHKELPKGKETDSFQVSKELADIIGVGLHYAELSDGAFDITIEPVSSLWDFTSGEGAVPDKEKIAAGAAEVGYKNLALKGNEVIFQKDKVGIDLGAAAKGYIADRIKEYLIKKGVKSAMINLGGNVLCVGSKPDGEAFNIGIQKPFADRNEVIATMELKDMSVVSSGIYERYFKKGDKIYHHILNPKTGYPYENDLTSVTIISRKSVDGDCLSTTCFALGLDKGLKLINSLEDTYGIFITKDYKIHYSDGFLDQIRVKNME